MTIADKLTLLASSKEALRVKLGLPKSLPFSEYYKHGYPFDPMTLFAGGKQGVWYDPSDKSTLFQDVAGTVPVTKDGDPVALMKDKSGNGYHATQSVSTARPTYRTDGDLHWLGFDGVDDWLTTSYITTSNWSSSVALRVMRYAGFIFDSNFNSINNYLASSSPVISVFGAPSNLSQDKGYTLDSNFLYSAAVTGDNIGNQLSIGARNSSGSGGFYSQIRLYGLIIRQQIPTANELSQTEQYLAKKSGVTL